MNHVQQQYIEKTLNPVLEKMVEQVLEELPEKLGDYLSAYFRKDGDAGAASADVQGLRTQNAKLQEELKALTQYCAELEKVIIQIAPMNAKSGGGAPAEVLDAGGEELPQISPEEESEAEDDEPPPDFEEVRTRPRTSVSAEAFGDWNKKKEFVPVVYAKRPEERTSLQAVLRKSFLFAPLTDADLGTVVDALKSVSVPKGTELIRQGDDVARCMYVVASGALTCFVAADGSERVVSTVEKGGIVGELALLYNCARAASVRASDGDVELWELDRDTFNAIVKESSVRARERNEAFLSKVTLLSALDAYDRSRIAESLRVETYSAGEHIIRVGDPGDRMFFVDEGICEASRVLEGDGPEEVVMEYRAGDFFGELAVIRNKVRQANVVAKTPVRVMALQTADFRRLCGTLEERMAANAKNYRGAVW